MKRLDRAMIPRVIASVEALAGNPYPTGSKKLQGAEHLWRIRLGDYRVIYSVDGDVLSIEVIKIGHRQSVYKH
ncbi:MAG: type II toxin-antitoxin system RelE/ParE family toxin [Desulfoarculaceae bacterium]|nr:type II toxin-antitoxin system RelE/ParE family toxin [Desulfoarculaceae bacterium]